MARNIDLCKLDEHVNGDICVGIDWVEDVMEDQSFEYHQLHQKQQRLLRLKSVTNPKHMHLMTAANFGVVEMHPSGVAADLTDGTAAEFSI
jgi:uncharacterized protein YjlB